MNMELQRFSYMDRFDRQQNHLLSHILNLSQNEAAGRVSQFFPGKEKTL